MIARYSTSVGVGAAITFGLLFIMQLLIATGADAVTDSPGLRLEPFIWVEPNEVIETVRDKPEKLPEAELPPELPKPERGTNSGGPMTVSVPSPGEVPPHRGTTGFGVSDGEYLPIFKVAPVYPSRALSRGLEGYVIVEFTVTRTGTVRDASVVESTSNLFNRAATEAVLRFKYKPRIIGGEAVEVPGVRNKISFEITNR